MVDTQLISPMDILIKNMTPRAHSLAIQLPQQPKCSANFLLPHVSRYTDNNRHLFEGLRNNAIIDVIIILYIFILNL